MSQDPTDVPQSSADHTTQSSPSQVLATLLTAVGSCTPSLLRDLGARRDLTCIWRWGFQPLFDVQTPKIILVSVQIPA